METIWGCFLFLFPSPKSPVLLLRNDGDGAGQAVGHLSIALEKKDCGFLVVAMEAARGGGNDRQQPQRMRGRWWLGQAARASLLSVFLPSVASFSFFFSNSQTSLLS